MRYRRKKKPNENLPLIILALYYFGVLFAPHIKAEHLLVIAVAIASRRLWWRLWYGDWYW